MTDIVGLGKPSMTYGTLQPITPARADARGMSFSSSNVRQRIELTRLQISEFAAWADAR